MFAMKRLESDWLTQGWLDAEYKKYVVMAYLHAVQQNFSDKKLYPDLPELRQHYEKGLQFRQGKGTLKAAFPKSPIRFDIKTQSVWYKTEEADNDFLADLDEVVDFAIPRFQKLFQEGQQLWNEILSGLSLIPIGLMPLRPEEGYLLIHRTRQAETQIYTYNLTLYSDGEPGGRYVHIRYVESMPKSINLTFENMKLDLVRRYRHLPNPATYMLESSWNYPVQETLLPIARQLIARAAQA